MVGVALVFHHRRLGRGSYEVHADYARLSRDQAAFLAVFALKLGLGLVAFAIKPWLGLLFLATYGAYVWREIRFSDTAPEEEQLEPLKIRPKVSQPSLAWAALQATKTSAHHCSKFTNT